MLCTQATEHSVVVNRSGWTCMDMYESETTKKMHMKRPEMQQSSMKMGGKPSASFFLWRK